MQMWFLQCRQLILLFIIRYCTYFGHKTKALSRAKLKVYKARLMIREQIRN